MTRKSDDHDQGDDNLPDDAVGYGKPPRHSRFKPGQTGNPKGRPKGAKSIMGHLEEALNEQVEVTLQGRRKKATKRKIIATQMVNKAAGGDFNAGRQLLALDELKARPDAQNDPFDTEADRELMKKLGLLPEEEGGDGK